MCPSSKRSSSGILLTGFLVRGLLWACLRLQAVLRHGVVGCWLHRQQQISNFFFARCSRKLPKRLKRLCEPCALEGFFRHAFQQAHQSWEAQSPLLVPKVLKFPRKAYKGSCLFGRPSKTSFRNKPLFFPWKSAPSAHVLHIFSNPIPNRKPVLSNKKPFLFNRMALHLTRFGFHLTKMLVFGGYAGPFGGYVVTMLGSLGLCCWFLKAMLGHLEPMLGQLEATFDFRKVTKNWGYFINNWPYEKLFHQHLGGFHVDGGISPKWIVSAANVGIWPI